MLEIQKESAKYIRHSLRAAPAQALSGRDAAVPAAVQAHYAEIDALARTHGAVPVTTEKDLPRLPEPVPFPGLLALRIEAEPHEPERLLALLRAALRGNG